MATKQNPGKYDCYRNAEQNEPMFILLARDASAPSVVECWARERAEAIATNRKPPSDVRMVVEAFDCAAEMRAWRTANRK